jgi:dinuclear metal center YbgI/SA1388 family protein
MTMSPPVLHELLAVLDGLAPPGLAEPWDNVGLMVGDPGREVTGVLVALDASEEILAEATRHGCNVVVTHHPLIFKPLPAIRTDQVLGRLLARALAGQVAVVSCHTNLDKVPGGVNDALAARLGLRDCRVLAAEPGGAAGVGFGRIGGLGAPVPGADFVAALPAVLEVGAVRVAGVVPERLLSVAVCGGSGSELAVTALELGAQVFITGEVRHSTARWAEDAGFCVIDAGHFSTERLVIPGLVAAIAGGCEARGLAVVVRGTAVQGSPFKYYFRR